MLSVAARSPATVGINARMMVQEPPAVTVPELTQVPLVRVNSLAFVPVTV